MKRTSLVFLTALMGVTLVPLFASTSVGAQEVTDTRLPVTDSAIVVIVIPPRGEARVITLRSVKAGGFDSVALVLVAQRATQSVTSRSSTPHDGHTVADTGTDTSAVATGTKKVASRRDLLLTLMSHVLLAVLLP